MREKDQKTVTRNVVDLESLVREEIRHLKPYRVERVDWRIKLNANENPYLLPPDIQEKVLECVREFCLNRYPDSTSLELREVLASQIGVEPDELIVGNGSNELIQMILTAFGGNRRKVLFPAPSYAMYKVMTPIEGSVPLEILLEENWDLDLPAMLQAIQLHQPKVILLSYPNNPTGNCFSEEKVLEILRAAPGVVIIDEAYFYFSRKTFLSRLREFPNLVILRTFSKAGMAGLRVGILVANRELVTQLNKIKLPYNLNTVSQSIAKVVAEHENLIWDQIRRILDERQGLFEQLALIEGITPFPTEANFVLFRSARPGGELYRGLIDEGIWIRNFSDTPYLENCLRVTIGFPRENQEFVEVLRWLMENWEGRKGNS